MVYCPLFLMQRRTKQQQGLFLLWFWLASQTSWVVVERLLATVLNDRYRPAKSQPQRPLVKAFALAGHAPGSPLPRANFVNDVGYLPDGTPLNKDRLQ